MHSNTHPNGSTYCQTLRHVLKDGRWTIAHAFESEYESKTECYRVIDIPLTGDRFLILRCERIKPEDAKGYGWKRAIEAADEAATGQGTRPGPAKSWPS